jgi:hypothetical protein
MELGEAWGGMASVNSLHAFKPGASMPVNFESNQPQVRSYLI